MEKLTNLFLQKQLEENQRDFINLKGKNFADYQIIYHINDCYQITDLSRFRTKDQLLFQKFESKEQQMNLMYVDTIFPILLSELALFVFVDEVKSFEDYLKLKKQVRILQIESDKFYLKYKIIDFIKQLVYSNIAGKTYSNGHFYNDRIYCIKNDFGEIDFYSIIDQLKLFNFLIKKIKLEIDFNSSRVTENEVNLCLKIFIN